MPRTTIVVRPDGRAIIAIDQELSTADRLRLLEALRAWEADPPRVLVLTGVEVTQVTELDFEDLVGPAPRLHEHGPGCAYPCATLAGSPEPA